MVPFTVPVQTAIELVFRAVLPPLSNGLGMLASLQCIHTYTYCESLK